MRIESGGISGGRQGDDELPRVKHRSTLPR
jgi:hypothetical protein